MKEDEVGHAATCRRWRSVRMKARTCASVDGMISTGLPRCSVVPALRRSTNRLLRAALKPKRLADMPVSDRNFSMSERRSLIVAQHMHAIAFASSAR